MSIFTLAVAPLFSQGAYIPPEKPALIVGIVVEQLRFDQLERLKDNFAERGLRKLMNEGTTFRNAVYGYLLTQGAPGFATIATGTEPSRHGIPSDSWYEPFTDELIYCTRDRKTNPLGGSYEYGLHSPANLRASTFSDELRMSSNGKSKVYGIGFTDYTAVLGAGHSGNGAFWFDERTGTWMSSTYYADSLPDWLNDFNSLGLSDRYLSGVWDKSRGPEYYHTVLPDSSDFETGIRGRTVFPYDLNKLSQTGVLSRKRDYSLLRETPFSNSLTTDLAIRLIEEEGLGLDEYTDYLSVAYSANDYIAHRFGPSSAESADALYRLDSEIERLLDYLNEKVGKRNILLYFTSAHGIAEVPYILEASRIPTGYFKANQAIMLLRTYLNAVYGQGDWVRAYHEKQIFLNRSLIEDAMIPLDEIQKRVVRFMVQFSAIAGAYPAYALETASYSSGMLGKISNNYNPMRSGDVFIVLQPGWVESGDYITSHNSPYDYDSHVPLIWYGWAVNRAVVTRRVNPSDIAVTLSAILKIPYPNASTGEPLPELLR